MLTLLLCHYPADALDKNLTLSLFSSVKTTPSHAPAPPHYYNTGLRGTEGATREVYPGELVLAGSNLDTLLWVCRGFTLIMVLSGCTEFFFLIWSNIVIFS